jgi:tetratricopeptide (TPR) repeat protein
VKRPTLLVIAMLVVLVTAASADPPSEDMMKTLDDMRSKAVTLFNKGQFDQAMPVLRKILSLNPDDKVAARYIVIFNQQILEPYCKQAADAYFAGNYPEAIALWEKILQVDPNDIRVQVLINETVAKTNQSLVGTYFDNVNNFMRQGNYALAVNELEKILKVEPENQRARELLTSVQRTFTDTTVKRLYEKADEYLAQGEYESAITQWEKVLDIDPNQEVASRQIAAVQKKKLEQMYIGSADLYEKGDYTASRDSYTRLFAENPTDQTIKRTIDRLNDVINIVPKISESGKVHYLLRKSLSHYINAEGDSRISVASAWYAVQLDPENALALAIRDFIEGQNIATIRAMETPVQDMNLVDQYLFTSLNNIYEGRYDRAIQETSLILELEPDNVLAYKRLGSAYYAMGRTNQARTAWQQALKLSPNDSELKEFIRLVR